MESIDITGIDKAELLAALFNASFQQGLGILDGGGKRNITKEEAADIIAKQGLYFDYLRGRIMKVNLEGDALRPFAYDRDNGAGSCAAVVASLRATVDKA